MLSAAGKHFKREHPQESWPHLKHFVLQFDFPVLLLLWMEIDVIQVSTKRGLCCVDHRRDRRTCHPTG